MKTFLFTDIARSTRLWEEKAPSMQRALEVHDRLLSAAVSDAGGDVVKTTGDGVLAVFDDAPSAVGAAIAGQVALADVIVEGEPLLVRMGLHTGDAVAREGDWFGPVVNRAARIMAAAHGGQILASARTLAGVDGFETIDHGLHRLRDLLEPAHLFEVRTPGRSDRFPPILSLDAFDQNLPLVRSAFFGRRSALDDLRELLARTRLLTLTGVGGVGKTRLAIELATELLDQVDGVVFVDLAAVTEEGRVLDAIATSAGLPVDAPDALYRLLKGRRLLVLLDNCEHVIEAAAAFAAEALSRSDSTVLATSREPLAVDGEHVWRVPSLASDQGGVDLFVERASAATATLTDQDREKVVAICEHLDGIPLAIELAASRAAHLSLGEIEARLDERFRFLTGGRRGARQRQQTLKATLDWSYDLLARHEQMVLRTCAVFSGSFGLAAFEAVTGGDLDTLASLIDKSLVVVEHARDASSRYRLLETVRLYADDRLLEAGETVEARDRHRDHMLAELERTPWEDAIGLFAATATSLDEVMIEQANIVAALDWSAAREDHVMVGRLAGRMIPLIESGLHADSSLEFYARDDISAALSDPVERAAYHLGGAVNGNQLGRFDVQQREAERSLETAVGFPFDVAAMSLLVNVLAFTDPERASELAERLVELVEGRPPRWQALAIGRSYDIAVMRGDLEAGIEILQRIEALAGAGGAGGEIGFVQHALGDHSGALAGAQALEDYLANNKIGPFRYRVPLLRAVAFTGLGRLDDARQMLVEAVELVERHPIGLTANDVVVGFAGLAMAEGDHQHAAALLAATTSSGGWARSPGTYSVLRRYRRDVRAVLSRAEVDQIRASTPDRSITDVLAAEIDRIKRQSR